MNQLEQNHLLVRAGARSLHLYHLGQDTFDFACPDAELPFWKNYFDTDGPYQEAEEQIPPQDAYLLSCARSCRGLRILRQDPFETLISFIISQRKSIPAIRACVEKLCGLCGEELDGGFAFPSPQALARLSLQELYSCSLGYRAPYIQKTACMVAQEGMPLPSQVRADTLMRYPGVGTKVANCVLLFAYHKLDTAPVDVWIQRVIDTQYNGISPFPSLGPYAGLYQQYMFMHSRQKKKL